MNKITFSEKYYNRAKQHSSFCFGIDPTPEILTKWQLDNSLRGLKQFCEIIKECLVANITLIKPQFAQFERFGPEGMRELQKLILAAKASDTLVLADCKRGDISHTMLAYAQAMLGADSPYQADAMTVLPYMSVEAMHAAIDYVHENNCAMFCVVRSSNPEANHIQNAKIHNQTLSQYVAKTCNNINQEFNSPLMHAVIGATLSKNIIQETIKALPESLYLSPGIGAQGASFEDIRDSFGDKIKQVIPTSSRGVLSAGPNVNQLIKKIEQEKKQAFTIN